MNSTCDFVDLRGQIVRVTDWIGGHDSKTCCCIRAVRQRVWQCVWCVNGKCKVTFTSHELNWTEVNCTNWALLFLGPVCLRYFRFPLKMKNSNAIQTFIFHLRWKSKNVKIEVREWLRTLDLWYYSLNVQCKLTWHQVMMKHALNGKRFKIKKEESNLHKYK